MSNENYIKLKKSSLQGVPFNMYDKDFTFIVNGEEYPTNRLIADILSPNISQLHSADPTIDRFTINTQEPGDFSIFLNLINFNRTTISQDDLAFISEIVSKLDIKFLQIHIEEDQEELTIDNAIHKIQKQEKRRLFFHTTLEEEIDFISSHFYELNEDQQYQLKKLTKSSIQKIVSNSKLRIENEDQILNFINELCYDDQEYSFMYEYVQFVNVTSDSMMNFLISFDYNQLNRSIWDSISNRLQQEIVNKNDEDNENMNKNRYNSKTSNELKKGVIIELNDNDKEFNGIINYIKNQSNNNVFEKLNITPSTLYSTSNPEANLLNTDPNEYYGTKNVPNSWICFDFIDRQVKLTHYKIQTNNGGCNMRNWKLEGSNDNMSWELLDEQSNCEYTNGDDKIHTFKINKQQNCGFRYIRIFATGKNWDNSDYFVLSSIDFYGTLI